VLWLGHFDLTNSMGIPGAFDHPDYLAAVARIVAACSGAGKAAGFIATDAQSARDAVARGFRILAYGVDPLMLQEALRAGLGLLRDT
jgi:2-dehydro-3-deoxyglucarate aldolase/4-hydroxy-2-oxoheptanedioate aldolase